jgi:ABC-type transporter Mla MlaB component
MPTRLWSPVCKAMQEEIQTVMKITPVRVDCGLLTLRLSGQFTKEYVPEVERTVANAEARSVGLDLANVTFVDREAMAFIGSAKSKNISIENCPTYVILWIEQERLCSGCSSPSDSDTQQSEASEP